MPKNVAAIPLLLNGSFVCSRAKDFVPVVNPATQDVIARAPLTTPGEVAAAVKGAKAAFLQWRDMPLSARMRLMLDYQRLLKEHTPQLAELVAKDNGKTLEDARGDVFRGIEVVEHACALPSLMTGPKAPVMFLSTAWRPQPGRAFAIALAISGTILCYAPTIRNKWQHLSPFIVVRRRRKMRRLMH